MRSLAIVGAGPCGTILLERLAANAPKLLPRELSMAIDVIDPYQPGAGHIWRFDQSPLLLANRPAGDCTMFTGEKSVMAGPIRHGPSFIEWAEAHHTEVSDPLAQEELRTLQPGDFASRRTQGLYLSWAFDQACKALPWNIRLRVHRTTAAGIDRDADGRHRLRLADGSTLSADVVALTLGHLDANPTPEQQFLSESAARHGLTYLPPHFASDTDFTAFEAGKDVLVRGFGPAFFDIVSLLTIGRGGHYEGGLNELPVYIPSGEEPRLHVGSRRGLPMDSKAFPTFSPQLPQFFGSAELKAITNSGRPIDFRGDILPLFAKELGWGYYHELFHAYPSHTTGHWNAFAKAYSELDFPSNGMLELVVKYVPDPADRFDLETAVRPLQSRTFTTHNQLREHILQHIARGLDSHTDPPQRGGHRARAGAQEALYSLRTFARSLGTSRCLTARQHAELDRWWEEALGLVAGPPPFQLRNLATLARAGIVDFLGPQPQITVDHDRRRFIARSPAVPNALTEATALIEARSPVATVHNTASPLLRELHQAGDAVEFMYTDTGGKRFRHRTGLLSTCPDGALLRLDGTRHPSLLAFGWPVHGRQFSGFLPQPGGAGQLITAGDSAARTILRRLAGMDPAEPPA